MNFPNFESKSLYISPKRENLIQIDSIYQTAQASLMKLPPDSRDCIFNDEIKLNYFPIYS